jgi:hypothetical protein
MKNMKLIVTLLLAQLLVHGAVFAQAPEKISYQAVVRNASNELITEAGVGMQISILKDGATGTAVYVERHFPTTNASGLVSLEIGMGTVISGDFAAIDWANGSYFVKTETDVNGGASYTISGTSQLLTVPYALHAKTVEEKQTLSLDGNKLSISRGNEVTLPIGGTETNNGGQTYLVLAGDITDEEAIAKIQADLGSNTQFVKVVNTTNLTSLDFTGFGIGELLSIQIEDNDKLEFINFPDLVNVWEGVSIRDNDKLTSVNGPLLIGAEYVTVSNNVLLSSFYLPVLAKSNSVHFYNNALVTLALDSYTSSQSVSITEDNLTSINLGSLINVSHGLTINAEKLTGLDLGSLEEVGYLSISNTLLTELDLSSLIELTESGVTNSTSISNNSNLVSIDLSALVLVRSSAQIYYSRNNLSSNSVFPFLVKLQTLVQQGKA